MDNSVVAFSLNLDNSLSLYLNTGEIVETEIKQQSIILAKIICLNLLVIEGDYLSKQYLLQKNHYLWLNQQNIGYNNFYLIKLFLLEKLKH